MKVKSRGKSGVMKFTSCLMALILCAVMSTGAQAFTNSGFISPSRYYDADVGRFVSADTIVPSAGDPQSLNRYAYVRNNPTIYTDPTGHKWKLDDAWNKIVSLIRSVFSQPPNQPRSGADENKPGSPSNPGIPGIPNKRNSELRSIVAAQQTPILFSGPTTVITWAVADSLSERFLNSGDYAKFASNIYGHKASDREKRALAAALDLGASYGYHKIAGYQPKTYKGQGYTEKGTDINDFPGLGAGIEGYNNIGFAHQGNPRNNFFGLDEGGQGSRFLNNVFGINAVAGVHDQFQVSLDERLGPTWRKNPLLNIGGMVIGAGITYPTLNWQPAWLFYDRQGSEW